MVSSYSAPGAKEAYEEGGYGSTIVGATKSFGAYETKQWSFTLGDEGYPTVYTYDGVIGNYTGSSSWFQVQWIDVRDSETGNWVRVANGGGETTFFQEIADMVKIAIKYDYDGSGDSGCEIDMHRTPVGYHEHP